MEKCLSNKVCIVTGAAQGIGKSIVEKYAIEGAIVYALDLKCGSMDVWSKEVSDKYETTVYPIYTDITDSPSVKKHILSIFKKEGKIDVLVNNAGVVFNRRIGMIVKDEVELMFKVNVIAVIELIQLVSRFMAKNKSGSIINISSVTAVVGSPGQVAYSSTKGAIISLTKSAAKEVASIGVRVNSVAPGIVKTERFEELYTDSSEKINERISKIALGRLAKPEDIAHACTFLASDNSAYISGQVLGVDGCASI